MFRGFTRGPVWLYFTPSWRKIELTLIGGGGRGWGWVVLTEGSALIHFMS